MIKSYNVISDHDGMRIDKWLKKNIGKFPQALIEKLLRLGKIKINKKKIKSNYKVKTNDTISCYNLKLYTNINQKKFIPTKKFLKSNEDDIIFNNNDYIVINKKSGISVQGGTKSSKNLVDIYSNSDFFNKEKPYTVHRLDKETSGLLIFAKNRKTAQLFTSLFRLRKIYKTYLCICNGVFEKKSGILINKLNKFEKNKNVIEEAITKYKVIDQNLNYSFLEMQPITGRKHQLRKQTSIIGHPIVGDIKYSFKNEKKKNLMLHAYHIKFILNKKKISFKSNVPKYFNDFLKSKKLNYINYV